MFTYADPRACPSCRTPSYAVAPDSRCPTCHVLLDHPRAAEVRAALERVDTLVSRLRAVSHQPVPVLVGAGHRPPAPPLPYPSVPPLVLPPARTGLRTSSVPAVLLGLGALCLLVAAVIFLAVAWGWLGVGGRTAVLAALTATAGGAGVVLGRRGLRLAAEALVSVSLGLLVLDVLGAERAGWLGGADGLSDAGLACMLGLVLALAGVGYAAALSERRLVVAQLTGVVGVVVAQAGLASLVGHDLLVAAAATVLLVAVAAAADRARGLAVTTGSAVTAAGLTWLDLTATALAGLDGLDALTLGDVWSSSSGVALLGAALLLLAPLAVRQDEVLVQLCTVASATMTTGLVLLPVVDDGADRVGLASLVAAGLWTAVAAVVSRVRLAVPLVPAAVSLLPALGICAVLAVQAVESALTPTASLRLSATDAIASPALLVPAAGLVAALLLVALPAAARRAALRVAVALLGLAALATLALQPVPLWTLVAAVGLAAAAYAGDGLRRPTADALPQVLVAWGLLLATVVVAAPSTALLVVPLALLSATAAAAHLVGRFPAAAETGGLLLPPALAALVWVLGDLAGLDTGIAVPVLGVLAAVVLLRPRVEVEVTAVLAGLVACVAAVPRAADETTSLALHLTLAGALLVAHALVHRSRRPLAWVGSALLVLATWVRLADLGVSAPEAYTLPTALGLVAVGLLRLARDRSASTATALLPGLSLATVPTLLHVLATHPVSLRAALLGAACLVLLVGGAQLRWSAPVLVGAVVGGLLVPVELAPYAVETPQWVVIGLAGTTLVGVGITWERRVLELRRAAAYVGRLR